ncbi:MAG: hypothetical protein QXH66_04805 [Conexivisphaerales archaeon]
MTSPGGGRACISTTNRRSTGNCAKPEAGRRTASMMPCYCEGKPRRIICLILVETTGSSGQS